VAWPQAGSGAHDPHASRSGICSGSGESSWVAALTPAAALIRRRLLWIGRAVAAGWCRLLPWHWPLAAALATATVSKRLAQLQPVRAEVEATEQQLIAEKAAIDATGKANATGQGPG